MMEENYKDPYKVLNITRKIIETISDNDLDMKILKSKDNLIKLCQHTMNACENAEKREKILKRIDEINNAYNLIKDKESRQKEEEKQLVQQEKTLKLLELKSLKSNIDNTLIKTKENGAKAIEEKIIDGKDAYLKDSHGRNLRIKELETINYCNSFGLISRIYEYLIERQINGITKKNKVFTDIDLYELSVKSNGEPINREYYKKVADELLSETNLFISKINANYIGVVEKTDNGCYIISTEDKTSEGTLKSTDRERLTVANSIMKKRKQISKEDHKNRIDEENQR